MPAKQLWQDSDRSKSAKNAPDHAIGIQYVHVSPPKMGGVPLIRKGTRAYTSTLVQSSVY